MQRLKSYKKLLLNEAIKEFNVPSDVINKDLDIFI